jgi:hypothetical protein
MSSWEISRGKGSAMLNPLELCWLPPEEVMKICLQTIKDYEVNLLRWLAVKRDYPWSNEPEPTELPVIMWHHRERIIRDFNRTYANR